MTDEQIEKALKLAVSDLSDCTQGQIIDYINRLKAEKAQIRKDTAKEILQELFDEKEFIQDAGSYPVVEARHIIGIADKYGVKIEG